METSNKKYIDADYLRQIVMPIKDHTGKIENIILYKNVETAPAADVEKVRHGKPIVYELHERYVTGAAVDETGTPFLMRKEYVEERERCPFCNATLFGEWGYYCDKCGAKMDVTENDE